MSTYEVDFSRWVRGYTKSRSAVRTSLWIEDSRSASRAWSLVPSYSCFGVIVEFVDDAHVPISAKIFDGMVSIT